MPHPGGVAVQHRIGNMALVAFFRGELRKREQLFPLILSKVIFNGIHGGDHLEPSAVAEMQAEVERLSGVHTGDSEDEALLRGFEAQMKDLVAASLKMHKPISF
jgi:hypothetical protein